MRKGIFQLGWAMLFIYLAANPVLIFCQNERSIKEVSIQADGIFTGYELIDTTDKKLFALAEHWHNMKGASRATLKTLKYLHQHANVRILAIEHGASVAFMINQFLDQGDTTMLRHIARNTMFWTKEHWAFFQSLKEFNDSQPSTDKIRVRSIDVEYKMESAVFVINQMLERAAIPKTLEQTLGAFKEIYESTKEHREQYHSIAKWYYYDKDVITDLVSYTLADLELRKEVYQEFFNDNFVRFAKMIEEMRSGLLFDYTNPNTNYKFRDRIIYWNFIELMKQETDKGVLCVIGSRHATKRSSIHTLQHAEESPIYGKVVNIRLSALYNKSVLSNDLKGINYNYPGVLKSRPATLIKHNPDDPVLRSKKEFHYTLFINESGNLTPFEKIMREDY